MCHVAAWPAVAELPTTSVPWTCAPHTALHVDEVRARAQKRPIAKNHIPKQQSRRPSQSSKAVARSSPVRPSPSRHPESPVAVRQTHDDHRAGARRPVAERRSARLGAQVREQGGARGGSPVDGLLDDAVEGHSGEHVGGAERHGRVVRRGRHVAAHAAGKQHRRRVRVDRKGLDIRDVTARSDDLVV